MKKFLIIAAIGFFVIYGYVTASHDRSSGGNQGGNGTNPPQTVTVSQQPDIDPQPPQPAGTGGKSSAYYAVLVQQYQDRVREDQKNVNFLQDNLNRDISEGTGYISAQMALQSAQQLLATDQRILSQYEQAYSQAQAAGR